ncbi:radical SAM protein [Salmonella enterica subsp. enterica serovar Larochelle]|jgi:radical SAM protein with 4Fe4S-binding SPASM domain|uniref:Radical SAM domain protein n=8 Tax=root TaxID=1 RepID=A0A7G9UU77_9CAUD|nr:MULTISPECIES: radical SAM protein [Enterobacteriaceae]YP_009153457.1 radical SAM domain-containing protein [Salmonella phage SPN3US]AMR59813.1 putative radical SAM superfamily protein 1 [Enterobacteria phage SEGD1]EAA3130921.1 radical SAM protein [Salmonella enterica subsp. enterica serovar Chester]EAB4791751.1 radical SAM protein [Salmonella enterica]EAB7368781.1 radical SAM protein [Salmonella enterica subsp. enterica serovar Virchow]EBH2591636.1 radical SAM protein [Salmonella enterica 
MSNSEQQIQYTPRTYQVVTNLSCNLDCEYCYERKYPRNNKVADVIDFIHACFERDKDIPNVEVIIDIIGGEPFMQPKLLLAAFETAEKLCAEHNRPYMFSISTNGTLLDRPLNKEIIERWKDKLSIGVSIDGLPEVHDKYRIFTTTREGSYEAAVRGYNYLKSVGIAELGVKATFTIDTLPHYAASMKSLIDMSGGGTISGNVTYEDILPRHMALDIANQMMDVMDYWIEKGLHTNPRNTITHIIPDGLNFMATWDPDWRDKLLHDDSVRLDPERLKPYCGTLTHMTCLGFDRKIYGCNRFMSTVTSRSAVAELVGREFVSLDGGKLLEEIQTQYTNYPETCLGCPMKHSCGSCAAASYENGEGTLEDRKAYHAERRQCGWTTAKLMAAEYWYQKTGTTRASDLHDKSMCYCSRCVRQRAEAEKLQNGAQNEVNTDSQFYEA